MALTGSIRNKIWLCVLVAIFGYLLATLTSFYLNSNMADNLTHLRMGPFPLSLQSSALLTTFDKQSGYFEEAFLMGEPEEAEKGNNLHTKIVQLFDGMVIISEEHATNHKKTISDVFTAYKDYFQQAAEIYPRAAAIDDLSIIQEQILTLGKKQKVLHEQIEALSKTFVTEFENHIEKDKENAGKNTVFLVVLFNVVLLLASVIINLVANRLLIDPLGKIQRMVINFGKGKSISPPEKSSSGDEISHLADSFYQLTQTLQRTTVSKNYVDNIIKSMTDCLIVLNSDAVIQTVNQTTITMLGYPESELLGRPLENLFCEKDDFVYSKTGLGELLNKKYIRNIEACCQTKSGKQLPVLFSGSVMSDEEQNITGIVCVIRDITELKKAEEALKGSYEFLKTVINSLNESVSIINVNNYQIESSNKVFLQNFNLREDEVTGKICYELIRGLSQPCSEPDHICPLQETVRTGNYAVAEHTISVNGGETKYLEISTSPIFDEKGELVQVVHVSRDITDSKKIKEQLQQMAHFDELTDVPNRTLFVDRLNQAISSSKRSGNLASVFFMDLDNFKPINDTLGHDAGDLVLKEAADRLKLCVRDSDTVGRIGGDEFTILLVNLDKIKDAEIVAQRVLDSFKVPFEIANKKFNVGISIGISFFPKDGQDSETLMKNADSAMYWAKQKEGKNTFCLYYSEV